MSPHPATRVLVADDNAVDRRVLAKIVDHAGFEVIQAVDGDDAVEKYYLEKPDMVLLDALMPGRDGFAVAEEIRSNNSDDFVPIIFLTSLTDATDLARCVEAGGDDFLSKPYNRIILQAKLQALQRMREVHQTVQSQRDEISRHHMQLVSDQEIAKAVFDKVAHAPALEVSYIKHLLSPLSIFNGDVLLAAQNPADHLYLLLGDFTGHGLAAAIGTLPLADVFYSMTAKGFALSEIVRECNRKLNSVLPAGYFCCATALMLDVTRNIVEVWNGGLPSAYLRKADSESIRLLTSNHLPLGIVAGDRFNDQTDVYEVDTNDRLFLATDGVIEVRNATGDYFGEDRLEDIISRASVDRVFEKVKQSVDAFVGEQEHDDDLTMVEVRVVQPQELESIEAVASNQQHDGPKDWKFSYELGPQSLKDFNPLPLLQQVLMAAPYLRNKATSIYAVLSELYSNALEHGVLGLRSELKSSAEGFAQYYTARAKALENVSGYVRFDIEGELIDEAVKLSIRVSDSGTGFDHDSYVAKLQNTQPTNTGYHGRGLLLLWDLCETVQFNDDGNEVGVTMRWVNGDE